MTSPKFVHPGCTATTNRTQVGEILLHEGGRGLQERRDQSSCRVWSPSRRPGAKTHNLGRGDYPPIGNSAASVFPLPCSGAWPRPWALFVCGNGALSRSSGAEPLSTFKLEGWSCTSSKQSSSERSSAPTGEKPFSCSWFHWERLHSSTLRLQAGARQAFHFRMAGWEPMLPTPFHYPTAARFGFSVTRSTATSELSLATSPAWSETVLGSRVVTSGQSGASPQRHLSTFRPCHAARPPLSLSGLWRARPLSLRES